MVRFSTSFLCLERDKTTTVVCLLPKIVLLSSFVSLFKRRAGVSPYRVRRHDATAFCRCARALRLVQRCRRARLLRARSSVPRRRRRRRGHTRCWGRVIDRRRRRRTKKAKNRISFWFFHPKRDLKNRL